MKEVLVKFWVWLTQRDNVDTTDKNRKKEPSNQCMIASFAMWCIQFGKWVGIDKWIKQFKVQTIEEVLHAIVMDHVNKFNEPILKQIEELRKQNASLNKIKALEQNLTSRFKSIHFIDIFNSILKDYGWKLVSEKATIQKIMKVLDTGQSVVCGTNIESFLRGASGHIQNFVGYRIDEKGKFLGLYSCDPYGNCETEYKDHNGACVFYKAETVNKLLSPCGPGDVRLMIYAVKL
jgi:hypothetical protein